MHAYGAKIVLSEGKHGMKGAINIAEQLNLSITNSYIIRQNSNQSNPKSHELTTGPEIARQCLQYDINPSYIVCGVGSGGTITGIGKVLKPKFPQLKMVAVEPFES